MDKKAIKNFAVSARRKLIDEVSTKAKRLGISENGIESAKQIDSNLQEIESSGLRIQGKEIAQRNQLIAELNKRAAVTSHKEAFQELVEEVAYTWFNRLIAIRFMEVNDYLPDTYRVLSSETNGKTEPDIITDIYDADIYEELSSNEQQQVQQWKNDNSAEAMDRLYRLVFTKICNQLNDYLPELFEKVEDYTELLFTASYIKQDGVIVDLLNVPEANFDIQQGGQVEIIGWLYQYYNSEPKDQVFSRPSSQKIRKQDIPAATQLFTPDWIVRYMVENSLGRFYIEKLLGKGDTRSEKEIAQSFNWIYYLETAEQPENVIIELKKEQQEKANYAIEDIHFIDPSMGSGHILVYAFELFMQLYENEGYSFKEAAILILEKNLFGLDIDKRAKQLAYFALMMKGREYNRQLLRRQINPNVFDVPESKELQQDQDFLDSVKQSFNDEEQYNNLVQIIQYFTNGKDFGSLIKIGENFDYELLMEKLKKFQQEQTNGLFAEIDILKLFQLVNMLTVARLLSEKYEVVVTNPPYMGSSGMNKILSGFAKRYYPVSKSDLFAMFIEQCEYLSDNLGYCGMITQQAWMFLSSYGKLRNKIIDKTSIINMANLGPRAFEEIGGEVVQTTTFILHPKSVELYEGVYIRLVEYTSQISKEKAYLDTINNRNHTNKFCINQTNFKSVPGMPIAYWIGIEFFNAFRNSNDISEYSEAVSKGIFTGANDRFLRLWHEVNIKDIKSGKWNKYAKGGQYRKWYGNAQNVILWENNAQKLRKFEGSGMGASKYYGKPHIVWSGISTGKPSFRYDKSEVYFDDVSPAIIFSDFSNLKYLLALLNSKPIEHMLKFIAPTMHFQIGDIRSLPIKSNTLEKDKIDKVVEQNIQISKDDWDSFETSWDFKINHIVSLSTCLISDGWKKWTKKVETNLEKLKSNEKFLNDVFINMYGLQNVMTSEISDNDISLYCNKMIVDIKGLISYSIGVIFGRYSLNEEGLIYAGGDWDPSRYRKFQPDKDNVLLITDDEYFKDGEFDIVNRFIDFVEVTFGEETLEENLQFIADTLGGKGTSREIIRRYFVKDFYKDHLKTYSNRPIYWQLDSGKQNGFKALMYLHRYTPDQLGKVRTEYLHELQKAYDNRIELRQQQISTSENQKEINAMKKEIEKIQKQLKEVREYDEKLGHLALKRIELDLDDGVIVNYDKLQRDPDTGEKYQILAKGVKEPKK
ncbi:BREX-1 system adenine-specific DNA-methyltransferase PglX [Enterococcus sp. AZ109]|uniref:BREX-1 system adenine-specific DNA-methyltransferase PglX n=1 Tax=Enterococcus sp. AZ109 TaxID=2774634 RepID=UPI003F29B751